MKSMKISVFFITAALLASVVLLRSHGNNVLAGSIEATVDRQSGTTSSKVSTAKSAPPKEQGDAFVLRARQIYGILVREGENRCGQLRFDQRDSCYQKVYDEYFIEDVKLGGAIHSYRKKWPKAWYSFYEKWSAANDLPTCVREKNLEPYGKMECASVHLSVRSAWAEFAENGEWQRSAYAKTPKNVYPEKVASSGQRSLDDIPVDLSDEESGD